MTKVIVNADDFGLCRGVNHGIIDSYRYGVVNSTTMLVNMPGTLHAVELAQQNPDLRVGVHLTLTCGKPVSENVLSLMKEDGTFRLTSTFHQWDTVVLQEIEKEWDAQIQRFLSFGIPLSHLDSHHHAHSWDSLLPVVQTLANRYNVKVRNVFNRKIVGVELLTDRFSMGFYGEKVSEELLSQLIESRKAGETLEIMCHPAYIDSYLKENSSYCDLRLRELDALISTKNLLC